MRAVSLSVWNHGLAIQSAPAPPCAMGSAAGWYNLRNTASLVAPSPSRRVLSIAPIPIPIPRAVTMGCNVRTFRLYLFFPNGPYFSVQIGSQYTTGPGMYELCRHVRDGFAIQSLPVPPRGESGRHNMRDTASHVAPSPGHRFRLLSIANSPSVNCDVDNR